MIATSLADTLDCTFNDPRYDVLLFAGDAGTWSWVVRLDGRTITCGGADDLETGRLRAERFVEDQLEKYRRALAFV